MLSLIQYTHYCIISESSFLAKLSDEEDDDGTIDHLTYLLVVDRLALFLNMRPVQIMQFLLILLDRDEELYH